ncbi:hypothetical protein FRB95_001574 [Tulasnella sp. JGI-2019a]|nr:hypothetical protein FRB95_001574 [Tulasnella sp. JGI-2019a]
MSYASTTMSMPSGFVEIDVSTTFFPAAVLPGSNGMRPDMIIFTSDAVFFYCHKVVLKVLSPDGLGRMIPEGIFNPSQEMVSHSAYTPPPQQQLVTVHIAESSTVINVILHIIYNMSCLRFAPSIKIISEALTALDKYGIAIPPPNSDIWELVLRHAPGHPIQAYAIAAQHSLDKLCADISPYTCTVSLGNISEAEALTMGPIYLRRLFFLHLGRSSALKRVIEAPPLQHRPARNCSEAAQANVARAWALVVAETLVKPMLQNMRVAQLREAFAVTMQGVTCVSCVDRIRTRVAEMCDAWIAIKNTI